MEYVSDSLDYMMDKEKRNFIDDGRRYPDFYDELLYECQEISVEDLYDVDQKLVKEELKKLSLLAAVIINLRFWSDYSLKDISLELGISYSTVEKIYFDTLTDLRDLIELDEMKWVKHQKIQ